MKRKAMTYGHWMGNPCGRPEDTELCRAAVWPKSGISHQCTRRRVCGQWCRQHARLAKKRKAKP